MFLFILGKVVVMIIILYCFNLKVDSVYFYNFVNYFQDVYIDGLICEYILGKYVWLEDLEGGWLLLVID